MKCSLSCLHTASGYDTLYRVPEALVQLHFSLVLIVPESSEEILL